MIMSVDIPEDAPRPRLCHLRRWPDFNGYGFNLHAEKGKVGHFVGKVDPDSPGEYAGLKEGDRIVEVNATNINNENHQQVVTRIKAVPNEVKMLVADSVTEAYYKEKRIFIRGDLPNIWLRECPASRGEQVAPVAPRDTRPNGTDVPRPRLCHLHQRSDFQGYGFNLHAEKRKPGQYIGKLDDNSPAEEAGLREGDRIIEINSVNIGEENHQQVVNRIKSEAATVRILVVDPQCEQFYNDQGIAIHGDMENILVIGDRGHDYTIPSPKPPPAVEPVIIHNNNEEDKPALPSEPTSLPRRCLIRKWPDFQGYGFHLHAEKGKSGHFIGGVEEDSPAEAAALKIGDRIVEVNGENVEDVIHGDAVEKIKAVPTEVTLLVVDPEADEWYRGTGIVVRSGMERLLSHETPERAHIEVDREPSPPPPEVAAAAVAAVVMSSPIESEPAPVPRLCILYKWTTFQGYGFNLHAEKGVAGHFIGKVDDGSPSEEAGLMERDIIVEVNGSPVGQDSHQALVTKIKSDPNCVQLLVVDPAGRDYYEEREMPVHGGMANVITIEAHKELVNGDLPVEVIAETEVAETFEDERCDSEAEAEIDAPSEAPPPVPESPPPVEIETEEIEAEVIEAEVIETEVIETEVIETEVIEAEVNGEPEPEVVPEPEPAPKVAPSPPPEPTPAPVAAPAAAPGRYTPPGPAGAPLGSAAEARERLSRKKKNDPRMSQMSLKEKYELFQNL